MILTNGDAKRGVLVRINTRGTYSKHSYGSVTPKGGKATLLTEGEWAEGDAGRLVSGPDQLWHVEGPCLFSVVLQGGESKGYGHRYLIVTKSLGTVMIKRAELCQLIATDENPEVAEVARMFQGELHEDVQQALRLAEELEEQMEAPQADVVHFSDEYRSIEDVITGFGLTIPAAMGDKAKGVSGVQSGTLLPGGKALVALEIGPGGGRRYRFEKISEAGLARVMESCERPYTRESVLAIAENTDWYSAWTDFRDGSAVAHVIANAGGVHSFTPDRGNPIRTQAWAGITPVTPTETEFFQLFNLGNDGAKKTESDTASAGGFNNPFAKLNEKR